MFKQLVAGAALLVTGTMGASAAPVTMPVDTQAHIVLVSGGCGFAFHRTPFGECVPNRGYGYGYGPVVRLPPPCPRGYHRDLDPARRICYPNL